MDLVPAYSGLDKESICQHVFKYARKNLGYIQVYFGPLSLALRSLPICLIL